MPEVMRQEAPWPADLEELVSEVRLDPGWQVWLENDDYRGQGSKGLTLYIQVLAFNTYNPEAGRTYRVSHLFPVPAASYNRRSWQWWLFERYLDVLKHEAMETFRVAGERPYAPAHGPGNDPYLVLTGENTPLDRATRSDGSVDLSTLTGESLES